MKPVLRHRGRGFALAITSAFGFALMGWCVNQARGAMGGPELAFWRGGFSVVLLLPIVWRSLPVLLRRDGMWLWMRSLAGAGSVLCFFWTLQRTSVATARAFADMAPAFVCFAAWLRKEEAPSRRQLMAIAVMTIAAVSLGAGRVGGLEIGTAAVGICGAMSASLAYVALRQAAQRYSNPMTVFALGLGLVLAAPLAPGFHLGIPPREAWFAVAGVCGIGLLAQIVFTRGFFHLSAPIASAMSVTALLFSVLLDLVLSGHRPPPAAWAAYAFIMAGASALHLVDRRRPPRASD